MRKLVHEEEESSLGATAAAAVLLGLRPKNEKRGVAPWLSLQNSSRARFNQVNRLIRDGILFMREPKSTDSKVNPMWGSKGQTANCHESTICGVLVVTHGILICGAPSEVFSPKNHGIGTSMCFSTWIICLGCRTSSRGIGEKSRQQLEAFRIFEILKCSGCLDMVQLNRLKTSTLQLLLALSSSQHISEPMKSSGRNIPSCPWHCLDSNKRNPRA